MASSKEHSVPRARRLPDFSTIDDLVLWKLMNENSFFNNEERKITAGDVQKALHYSWGGNPPTMDRPKGNPPIPARARMSTLRINAAHHARTLADNLRDLGLPHTGPERRQPCQKVYPPHIPKMTSPEPENTPIMGNRMLQRRPRPPRKEPKVFDLPEIKKRLLDKEELDSRRYWSFTTLYKEEPMDPNSFYNRKFPIILKQIPRRRRTVNENSNDLYVLMASPEITISYFNKLPHGPVSICNVTSEVSVQEQKRTVQTN